jgi:predicted nucleotidyltransferase
MTPRTAYAFRNRADDPRCARPGLATCRIEVEDATGARRTLRQLTLEIERHFGSRLLGLYLFGSLAAGGFYPGKSDLDLIAVVESDLEAGEQLEALERLHAAFVSERSAWVERVEVAYVSREVLQTFGARPQGKIAVISPGEPLHIREADFDSTLDWYSVCTQGETLLGPPPLDLGPTVTRDAFSNAVRAQLSEWPSRVRAPWVAYVPAHQGYVVVTLCRALYALETGEQATKETAAAWAAAKFPEWSTFINSALTQYRADVHGPHRRVIEFTDHAVAEADRAKP